MAKRKKTDFVQFKVRFREHLRGRLEAAAKTQERSLNSEIVARLEESFVRDRGREEREDLLKTLEDMSGMFTRTADLIERRVLEAEANRQSSNEAPRFITETADEEPELFTEMPRQQEGKK